MTRKEQNLVRRAEKFGKANEYAHDQTRQRAFERRFLSLSYPDAKGDLRDYGDCGRAARRLFRDLDAPYRAHVRELRFRAALEKLPEEWRPMLRMLRERRPRAEIMRRFQISRATYFRRLASMVERVAAR